ncbi:MAG TPA: cytochrome c peroxidase [Longimicrobiaceae bacterium]|nr:cytochrome c peroxidase [Longimicrobiaceae bacterium]
MKRLHPLVWFACAFTVACAGDAGTGATPVESVPALTIALPNGAVAATVGSALSYDATRGGEVCSNPAGGAITYTITFSGPSNGLSATGGRVTGTPTTTGVVDATLTATDRLGRTVTDAFAIAAFAPGLPAPVLPTVPAAYDDASLPLPAHFLANIGGGSVLGTDNTPASNPTTNAGATLGRVLFYDTRLSANDGTSCASCHIQSLGFADTAVKSVGFAGGLTGRHASALGNARFYRRGRFFWDERAATLEAQVVTPIQDATEMGMRLDALVRKLSATTYYAPLFTAAFGSPTVTDERIARALAQYVRALRSTGSRYDRAFAGGGQPDFSGFTAQERQGEQVFRTAGCARCHTGVAQVSDDVHNTGLDATITDVGAGNGAFKAPSLRNVALRGRFMHDGRFTSLQQVVGFYDSGVQPNPGLDPRLRAPDGTPLRLRLTAGDRAALVAFMGTLTDSTLIAAPRFSNPFPAH